MQGLIDLNGSQATTQSTLRFATIQKLEELDGLGKILGRQGIRNSFRKLRFGAETPLRLEARKGEKRGGGKIREGGNGPGVKAGSRSRRTLAQCHDGF